CRIFSDRYGKRIQGVSTKASDYLHKCPWNGNIRELKNVIGSAVATAQGEILRLEDFIQGDTDAPDPRVNVMESNDYYAYFVKLLEPRVEAYHPDSIGSLYQTVCQGLEKASIDLAL